MTNVDNWNAIWKRICEGETDFRNYTYFSIQFVMPFLFSSISTKEEFIKKKSEKK